MQNQEQIATEQAADKMVNAMPASKMLTRSMARATRSSAATDHESKKTKADDLVSAPNPEQEQADAPEKSADDCSKPDQPEAQKEAEPAAENAAVSTEAGGSEAAAEDKPAEAGAPDSEIITTTAAEDAKPEHAASQPASKKRDISEITGANEQAATEKEQKAESARGSKRLKLNDGTMVECPPSNSAETKTEGKADMQDQHVAAEEVKEGEAVNPATTEAPTVAQEPLESDTVAVTESEVAAAAKEDAAVDQVTEQVQQLKVDDAPVEQPSAEAETESKVDAAAELAAQPEQPATAAGEEVQAEQ